MADPTVVAIAASAPPPVNVIAQSADVVKALSAGQVEVAQAKAQALANASLQFNFHGYSINMVALMIGMIMFGILYMFYNIQKQNKLDFADMITKDGRSVSLTKVLQLLGGVTATWIMIKLTLTNALTESLFGIYLTYVGAIEGYSKYVAAKYGYTETSVKDGGVGDSSDGSTGGGDHSTAQKILKDAVAQATDAEASARDAKVSAKNAAIDLQEHKDN